jgi:hypothetical protein
MNTPMQQPFLQEMDPTLQDPPRWRRLLDLMATLTPAHSGRFVDLQGQPLPW